LIELDDKEKVKKFNSLAIYMKSKPCLWMKHFKRLFGAECYKLMELYQIICAIAMLGAEKRCNILAGKPLITQYRELARQLCVSHTKIRKHLERLDKAGLIKFTVEPKKPVHIYVTNPIPEPPYLPRESRNTGKKSTLNTELLELHMKKPILPDEMNRYIKQVTCKEKEQEDLTPNELKKVIELIRFERGDCSPQGGMMAVPSIKETRTVPPREGTYKEIILSNRREVIGGDEEERQAVLAELLSLAKKNNMDEYFLQSYIEDYLDRDVSLENLNTPELKKIVAQISEDAEAVEQN